MEADSEFHDALKQLAEGNFEPDAWLAWWVEHGDQIKTTIKQGQWLRLKPKSFGDSPASRTAMESQKEARKLLDEAGIEYRPSDRYQAGWEAWFADFCERQEQERKQRTQSFQPVIDSLKSAFPKFGSWLERNPEVIESLSVEATDQEIAACEASLKCPLPERYQLFLSYCGEIDLGDSLKIGLPQTSKHEQFNLVCFGECWLDGDGDQVLFADSSSDPPILYYDHETGETETMAESFTAWLEQVPTWDCWE